MEKRVFTVALEGAHRAGKGTQIELLKEKLHAQGVPCMSVRGEGYRNGNGDSESNPKSDFWVNLSARIQKGEDPQLWDHASYRIARELLVWRDKVMEKKVTDSLEPQGILLVDRSLLSRAVFKSLKTNLEPDKIFSSDDLYPKLIQQHKKITVDMILPDMIVELVAPKNVLLERLKASDPEYLFRKKNIEESYHLYLEAKNHLPESIKERIFSIDSTQTPEEISKEIIREFQTRFPSTTIQ